MTRTVYCEFEKRDAEGLDFAPWPGEAGQRVFAHIGKPAWAKWLAHQTMLINENRLSPMDPAHRRFLQEQMLAFLFEGNVTQVVGYVPPEQD
ncbi:oxidative damage protection protein [Lysobacter sp. H21R4]|uniref:oxidative damage protection protein n=1 Tax=Lysobacter sp. H21R4 TaxID=2781021 RepID=UPI001886B760|nr:oxidative damage protection protein [Lysobacter sp. H21R4]QOY63576.1 oxidative damage protection protein [Lysobacter sp. H21R4]